MYFLDLVNIAFAATFSEGTKNNQTVTLLLLVILKTSDV